MSARRFDLRQDRLAAPPLALAPAHVECRDGHSQDEQGERLRGAVQLIDHKRDHAADEGERTRGAGSALAFPPPVPRRRLLTERSALRNRQAEQLAFAHAGAHIRLT